MTELHKGLALGAVGFSLLHVVAIVETPAYGLDAGVLIAPFTYGENRIPATLGTVALLGLTLIVSGFYFRRFLGAQLWRVLHQLTLVLFASAVGHGLLAGDGAGEFSMEVTYVVPSAVVVLLVLLRLAVSRGVRDPIVASAFSRRPALSKPPLPVATAARWSSPVQTALLVAFLVLAGSSLAWVINKMSPPAAESTRG